jgi:predicted neuraminidase
MRPAFIAVAALAVAELVSAAAAAPLYQSEFVISKVTPRYPSGHASTIVEPPNGGLLCAWYAGQQEAAQDVAVWYSRKAPGSSEWTTPAILADDPHHPEGNPVLFEDPRGRVALLRDHVRGWLGDVQGQVQAVR